MQKISLSVIALFLAALPVTGQTNAGAEQNPPVQPIPAIQPASTEQPAVISSAPTTPAGPTAETVAKPQPAKWCKADSRIDVKQFCQMLTALMQVANSRKSEVQIRKDAQIYLTYLDPATQAGQQMIASTITTMVKQAAATKALQDNSQSILQTANQMTTNQQLGAVSGASGTSSLVSKAGGTAITNLAIDTGALTRSVNGSTATLTLNTDELFKLVTGQPEYSFIDNPSRFEKWVLNPLSLTASFSLNQTDSTTAPASGQASGTTPVTVANVAIPSGAGKLTSFTAKYEVPNKYNPRSDKFKSAWVAAVANLRPRQIAAGNASFVLTDVLQTDPTYQSFVNKGSSSDCEGKLLDAAKTNDGPTLAKAFHEACWQPQLGEIKMDLAPLVASVQNLISTQVALRSGYRSAILAAAGSMFSAQYTFNRPADQPATHDLTAIYNRTFVERGALTFNGAVSIYNGTLPAGANYGRIHYGQVSAEYDRTVTKPSNSYQTQISFAGYWQYQPQPSILNIPAGTVAPGTSIPLASGTQVFVGTAGSLWVGQGKITIKGPGGINIPIGISGSNKTDLLQGTKIGAQVGLSYDFSSFASLFGH